MKKHIFYLSIILLLFTACGSPRGADYSPVEEVSNSIVRETDNQYVQVSPGQVLPPYGIKVKAESVELSLHIKTSEKESAARIQDLQSAIQAIKAEAAKTGTITVGEMDIGQVNSSYPRLESETSNIQNIDSSTVTLKLTTNLSDHDNDYLKCVAAFNDFLNMVNLPKTIDLKTISIESKLGDLETYRSQIIDRVYQEIDAVQQVYGKGMSISITGLYGSLNKMQLNDIEYYLYLEPVVTISEF